MSRDFCSQSISCCGSDLFFGQGFEPGLDAADGRRFRRAVDHLAPLAAVVDPGWHRTVDQPSTGRTDGLEVDGADVVVLWKYIETRGSIL